MEDGDSSGFLRRRSIVVGLEIITYRDGEKRWEPIAISEGKKTENKKIRWTNHKWRKISWKWNRGLYCTCGTKNPHIHWNVRTSPMFMRVSSDLPVVGLEPTRSCPQKILSLPRLPFRHTGWNREIITHIQKKVKDVICPLKPLRSLISASLCPWWPLARKYTSLPVEKELHSFCLYAILNLASRYSMAAKLPSYAEISARFPCW